MADSTDKVVMEQSLVKIDEAFVYRIPPMKSADGHRAEDWNLAKPLATCKLEALRRDNSLCINIMADRPKPGAPAGATETYLFAQSNITVDFSNPSHKMDRWVMSVVDSSRYFALRISDPKTGREAFIGVGFRERMDATNFKMSLQDYENSLKREEKAAALQRQYEQTQKQQQQQQQRPGDGGGDSENDDEDASTSALPVQMESKLSLKEGEKIHINLAHSKVKKAGGTTPKQYKKSLSGSYSLKLPPPPGVIAPPPSVDTETTKPEPKEETIKGSGGTGTEKKETSSEDVEWGAFEG
mmetsp:Transcript_22291/g.46866  ORF Transcript_22291/g.46866 Transcript_22291/m.46866 type:complete len:298 (-) Transcript_22291:304-1197(-)